MSEERHHDVMARRCGQCLYTKDRIVPAARARQIIADCRRTDSPFLCHKGTIEDRKITCHGSMQDTGGGQLGRIMGRIGAIRWIDPDTLEPTEAPEGYR